VDVFFLVGRLDGKETAFVGVGVSEEVVDAGLVEEGGDEVGRDSVEGERGDGGGACGYRV
jgi:hypothetical protein